MEIAIFKRLKKIKRQFLSGYYVVESWIANFFGAQVLRYCLAAFSLYVRRLKFSKNITELDDTLHKDGLCILKDFLSVQQVDMVNLEFNKVLRYPTDSFEDGSTYIKRSTLADFDIVPCVSEHILKNPSVINLVQNAEGRQYDVGEAWFDIVQNGDPAVSDSQKVMHTDNFYATHKMWYFLDDVTLEHGPLVVAPGTSRFSFTRAIFEYLNSINYASQNIAWRPSARWKKIFKLRPMPVVVPANTLVIANTHAFHQRGDAVEGMERRHIHFRMRIDPMKKMFSFVGDRY